MCFQFSNIGMTADIEKAFLYIGLHPVDRDVMHFFSLSDSMNPESDFEIYQFKCDFLCNRFTIYTKQYDPVSFEGKFM